ncbi:hypothetical protein J5N97_010503 [Dioscorea zingiberensis]|uniref:Protease Do-like PDZ domain-containing protein n=1 Tax=Dioscorea zingiberensis TaxID=325984 RepID=A0A9D5HMQ4_9LILI|nr:hypothetical protein J5N97_010503 [Dioscorea zingiberensis]
MSSNVFYVDRQRAQLAFVNAADLEVLLTAGDHDHATPPHRSQRDISRFLRSKRPYGKDYELEAPVKLLDKHLHSMAQSPDEQLVVVSQVLAFNGKPIKNLSDLAKMVENCNEEFLQFNLEY